MPMAASSSSSRSAPPNLVTTARSAPSRARVACLPRRAGLCPVLLRRRERRRDRRFVPPPRHGRAASQPFNRRRSGFFHHRQSRRWKSPHSRLRVASVKGVGFGVPFPSFVLSSSCRFALVPRVSFSSRVPWVFSISSDLRSRTKPVGLWAILLLLQPNHFQPNHQKKSSSSSTKPLKPACEINFGETYLTKLTKRTPLYDSPKELPKSVFWVTRRSSKVPTRRRTGHGTKSKREERAQNDRRRTGHETKSKREDRAQNDKRRTGGRG